MVACRPRGYIHRQIVFAFIIVNICICVVFYQDKGGSSFHNKDETETSNSSVLGLDNVNQYTSLLRHNAVDQHVNKGATPTYMDHVMCDVNCTTGVPCEYKDELDFRVIVITYKRSESLRKCLKHVSELDTMGDRVGVDIWLDRSKEGEIDNKTLQVALDFQKTWKNGRACVHKQTKNAYIIGQWVDTWRPREGSHEMALILEDDIDISPFAYRWLKHVNQYFYNTTDVGGYTLQMENLKFVKGKFRPASGPKSDTIFLKHLTHTWGFSPVAKHWRNFQDWFHKQRKDTSFQPYLPYLAINSWYKTFVKKGKADSMWEMWSIYYFIHKDLFTVCSNLLKYTGRPNVLLDTNRREQGLHYGKGSAKNNSINLMRTWDPAYVKFPEKVVRYDLSAAPIVSTVVD